MELEVTTLKVEEFDRLLQKLEGDWHVRRDLAIDLEIPFIEFENYDRIFLVEEQQEEVGYTPTPSLNQPLDSNEKEYHCKYCNKVRTKKEYGGWVNGKWFCSKCGDKFVTV